MNGALLPRVALVLSVAAASASGQTAISSPNPIENGLFGAAVARIPDITGDGKEDYAIGASGESFNNLEQAGLVYVYDGVTGALIRTLHSPVPTYHGQFGAAVGGVPDANGDGRGDIVIGAPQENWGPTFACGKAYVFSGANGALLATLLSPGLKTGGQFGSAVAGFPDASGDGRGDVVIGAPGENPGASPSGCGRAYIYRGSGGLFARILPSHPMANGGFGTSVTGLADINGDGLGDVVVGAPRTSVATDGDPAQCGRAYLISGATGRAYRYIRSPGTILNGFFGESVSVVPDASGDGINDIAVGAPLEHPGPSPVACGRAYIFYGHNGRLFRKLIPPIQQANGEFGISVAGVPDTNGDGRGDVIVGAWKESVGAFARAGRAHLYSGATAARIITYTSTQPMADGFFGSMSSGLGGATTLNGGALIGAAAETSGGLSDAGRAYLIRR